MGNKQWDIPKLRQLLETLLPRQTTLDDYEVEHEFADIGRRTILLNAREIPEKSGKDRLILLAMEDIIESKRQENLLADSEERYTRLFETANDGIVLLEKADRKITHANSAIKEILGCRQGEPIGKGLMDIGIPRDIGTINSMYWDFLSRNRRELSKNPRMAIMYGTLDRMNEVRKVDLFRQAEQYRASVHHL